MNIKILKKLREQEEKLIDAVYSIRDLLDSTEDDELSSMGVEFCDNLIDFIDDNDTMSINDIKTFLEESLD